MKKLNEINMSLEQNKTNQIKVATGIDSGFIKDVLVSDIDTHASIFDLIDNSVDSAKRLLIQSECENDEYGMPKHFNGYEIQLFIEPNSFIIEDNCQGFTESELVLNTLVVGRKSSQVYGLGKYGVGLKRALVKLGNTYYISSDSGAKKIILSFNRENIGNSSDLMADVLDTDRARLTHIKVSNLNEEIIKEFRSQSWLEDLISEVSIRYSIFIQKGLAISVQTTKGSHEIKSVIPQINRDSNAEVPIKSFDKISDNVHVFIDSGIHTEYIIKTEENENNDSSLTSQFGWYILCNDRVIEFGKRYGEEFGWKTIFHGEYYGFIGFVRFFSPDVEKLPWDSTKTIIKKNSLIYREILDNLTIHAAEYRKISRRVRKKNDNQAMHENPTNDNNQALTDGSQDAPINPLQNAGFDDVVQNATQNTIRNTHIDEWVTLLPSQTAITNKITSLDNCIIESKRLELKSVDSLSHTCAVIYRVIVESALINYAYKTGKTEQVKDLYFGSSEGRRRDLTDDDKRRLGLTHKMVTNWLRSNLEVFPIEDRRILKVALTKTIAHYTKLNGVVHCSNSISYTEMVLIRNETYPLLDFLINEIADS